MAASTGYLWLLRHGQASDPPGVPDAERPLTERGEAQAASAGRSLAIVGATPAAVLCSPRLRARRTAELAAEAHGTAPAPVVLDELGDDYTLGELLALASPWLAADAEAGPGDALDDRASSLVHASEPPSVLVVGHNPTLAWIVQQLTGDERGLPTGTLIGIDLASRTLVEHIVPDV